MEMRAPDSKQPEAMQVTCLPEESRARLSTLIESITGLNEEANEDKDVHTGMFILDPKDNKTWDEVGYSYYANAYDPLDEPIPNEAKVTLREEEQCESAYFIQELLKKFGIFEFLSAHAKVTETHKICVQVSAYHNRTGIPALHRDGPGNLLFLILAFANKTDIPGTTVFFTDESTEHEPRKAWDELPDEIKEAISGAKPPVLKMYEGYPLSAGACTCIIDERTYHGSPFERTRSDWANCSDTEREVEKHLNMNFKDEELNRAKAAWQKLKSYLLEPYNRRDGVPFFEEGENAEQVQFKLRVWCSIEARLCPSLLMLRHYIRDTELGPANNVAYSDFGTEKIEGLRARAASLGESNTVKSAEKRRFIRIWVKIIHKKYFSNKTRGFK